MMEIIYHYTQKSWCILYLESSYLEIKRWNLQTSQLACDDDVVVLKITIKVCKGIHNKLLRKESHTLCVVNGFILLFCFEILYKKHIVWVAKSPTNVLKFYNNTITS